MGEITLKTVPVFTYDMTSVYVAKWNGMNIFTRSFVGDTDTPQLFACGLCFPYNIGQRGSFPSFNNYIILSIVSENT